MQKKFMGGLLTLCLLLAGQRNSEPENRGMAEPPVCRNVALLGAMRIIDQACNELSCDFSTLRQLDRHVEKAALLRAFRDPDIQSVHIFFPVNESNLYNSFDWNVSKRQQLTTLKYLNDPNNAIVYVLGRASTTGDFDLNQRLSRERMLSVMTFLKRELHVQCYAFHGGWFGKEIQQWTLSDASFLGINSQDYRSDELILNQSVHVFVFPCKQALGY